MMTKYGLEIADEGFNAELDLLVGKIYKLLPMFEQKTATLGIYHASFITDLIGKRNLFVLHENGDFVSLLCSLEGLMAIKEKPAFRSKVFECIRLVKKLKK